MAAPWMVQPVSLSTHGFINLLFRQYFIGYHLLTITKTIVGSSITNVAREDTVLLKLFVM